MDTSKTLQQQIDDINMQINNLDESRGRLIDELKDLEEQLLFVTKITNDDTTKKKFKELFDNADKKNSDI